MALIELPHTSGCLVCGRHNPHGLHLSLFVDRDTGHVETRFTPRPEDIGFEGIVHGGVTATVIDEAMVWAATWQGKRFCVCGEFTTRFRHQGKVGRTLTVRARVEFARPRLIETAAQVFDESGVLVATGNGKYVPVDPERSHDVVQTFVLEPSTTEAASMLAGRRFISNENVNA
jgi:acyl-coenzyme A thioesterase PaaI-like protein